MGIISFITQTRIAIIISITRDIDTSLGVGFDVIKLTSSKSKNDTYNILTQFEQLYCNNNWYTLNNKSIDFTDLYNLTPIIKRSWSLNNLDNLDYSDKYQVRMK